MHKEAAVIEEQAKANKVGFSSHTMSLAPVEWIPSGAHVMLAFCISKLNTIEKKTLLVVLMLFQILLMSGKLHC